MVLGRNLPSLCDHLVDLMLFFDFVLQTTLLNHILTAEHGKRIAVIENEV